ncbi:hypothetical protein NVP1215B_014 [Vibrio phage 1.215.B._10N.222.54.F7]|nr:hypothetical protein NVP1215A_014 [Vibrio phage 1.215.A._10N.222.54.F7]AUR96037.1 hypothetical protein NVP1215B_014 [Vibrio phage 1.215.B._10N.222.54.F7]
MSKEQDKTPKHPYEQIGLTGVADVPLSTGMILEAFPQGKFDCIYMDLPWQYSDTLSNGDRGAAHKYDTMSIEEIKQMPIPELLKPNSTVWMWSTTPFTAECMKIAEHWGLELVTRGFLWVKRNKNNNQPFLGLGHHTRGNPEDCWLFRPKGSKMKPQAVPPELINARIREHSRKPDEAINRINDYCGEFYQDKLELFCRTPRKGWAAWGNDLGKFEE